MEFCEYFFYFIPCLSMDFFFRFFFIFPADVFLHVHPWRCDRSSPTVDADPGYTQRTLSGNEARWQPPNVFGHPKCMVPFTKGCFLNGGTPKSSILIGFSIINHPFWGTTILGNPHIKKLL